jgi:hypothetical protein
LGDGIVTPMTLALSHFAGKEAEIKKIAIRGTKRLGYALWLICEGPLQPFSIQLEKAIETGELVIEGYTSDQALEELLKAKSKLDFALISQEEFDSLKTELSKYIK